MTTLADHSLAAGLFSHEGRAPVATSRREHIEIAGTRWASPPPGASRNAVYLMQLGLLIAALLIVFGVRMVG